MKAEHCPGNNPYSIQHPDNIHSHSIFRHQASSHVIIMSYLFLHIGLAYRQHPTNAYTLDLCKNVDSMKKTAS